MQRARQMRQRSFKATGLSVGVVVAEYNADITDALLSGALATLRDAGVRERDIRIVRVPGSFEVPLACRALIRTRKPDAVVALGCVLKGETKHDEYIASAVSHGLMRIMLENGVPIGFGILTPNTLAQARARSRGAANKGAEAAAAALQMALSDA